MRQFYYDDAPMIISKIKGSIFASLGLPSAHKPKLSHLEHLAIFCIKALL